MTTTCPICRAEVADRAAELSYRPFCSRRCKQIDLGNWLSEKYRIPEPLGDQFEERGQDQARAKD